MGWLWTYEPSHLGSFRILWDGSGSSAMSRDRSFGIFNGSSIIHSSWRQKTDSNLIRPRLRDPPGSFGIVQDRWGSSVTCQGSWNVIMDRKLVTGRIDIHLSFQKEEEEAWKSANTQTHTRGGGVGGVEGGMSFKPPPSPFLNPPSPSWIRGGGLWWNGWWNTLMGLFSGYISGWVKYWTGRVMFFLFYSIVK